MVHFSVGALGTAVAAPVLDALGRQATSLTATGALLLAALLGRR
ncbi:hypothetical protein ABT215_10715 [Streptomyces sp900105755]